ncbi:MAG: hypothetical protein K0V04_45195 [Deltaproteobacteria bacterium]|nr:hypothetical protein [Deltaproteobacteria bacterium]
MIVTRRINLRLVILVGLRVALVSAAWAAVVYMLYAYAGLHFLRIPFQPISTIGIAVAFYVGFKNNASYDRFWEGRKIWGGIVNASRTWATNVMSYIHVGDDSTEARALRRELIYRQLAWVNALRLQLRKTSRFFDKPSRGTKRRLQQHGDHMRNDWDTELSPFLSAEELTEMSAFANPATNMLTRQGQQLATLVDGKQLNLFHQIAMMDVVRELYALQGKCERIKNTPFPRQYAEFSRVFTRAFTFLVPLGLLDVFAERIEAMQGWGMLMPVIPMFVSAGLISWVFNTMEGIGDASEDPFERSMNDVPMNSLSRTIEIDLRQMLGETDLPSKEPPAGNIMY